MAKTKKESCCDSIAKNICGCKVQSVVSIDERGQMIIPKEIRDRANICAGDKLTLVSWEKDNKIRCISLIRAEDFAEMVKDMLGPVMKDMFTK